MSRRKEAREHRRARLIAALKRDPELTNAQIKTRFGITDSTSLITSCRREAGIAAPDASINLRDEPGLKTPERYPRLP